MRRKADLDDPMRCPRCGSRHCQSLEMAYSQAARIDSRVQLSEFAKRIAPTRRWSTFLWPLVGGVAIGCGAGFLTIQYRSPIHEFLAIPIRQIFDLADLAVIVVGFVTAIIWILVASWYNRSIWSRDYAKWRRKAVCRRCSLVFTPSVDLANEPEE